MATSDARDSACLPVARACVGIDDITVELYAVPEYEDVMHSIPAWSQTRLQRR